MNPKNKAVYDRTIREVKEVGTGILDALFGEDASLEDWAARKEQEHRREEGVKEEGVITTVGEEIKEETPTSPQGRTVLRRCGECNIVVHTPFCPHCGASASNQEVFCCGQVVGRNYRFCGECGKKVR